MNERIALAAVIVVLPLLLLTDRSFACNSSKVNLHLSSSKIHISNGLRCVEADDPSAINETMTIKLPSVGNYELQNAQVVVTTTDTSSNDDVEFPVKSSDDASLACDPGIEFSGTNVGNNDMSVSITGEVTTTGVGCYDIVIKGLGRLDPRAKIVERNIARGLKAELTDFFEAVDILQNSAYGPIFDILTLEEFFQSAYGISEEEARQIVSSKSGD